MSLVSIRCTWKSILFPSTIQFPNNTLFVCTWYVSFWLGWFQNTLVIYEMLHWLVMLTWEHLEQLQSRTNNHFSEEKEVQQEPRVNRFSENHGNIIKDWSNKHLTVTRRQSFTLLRKNQIGLWVFFPILCTESAYLGIKDIWVNSRGTGAWKTV